MTEHTTIQITKAQANELQDRKTHDDESYKSVIARLLDGGAGNTDEEIQELINELAAAAGDARVDDDAIAREVVRSMDYAELANQVATELEGRMR